jgi:hypothetical protein
MFFKRKKKSEEQVAHENKVMKIHKMASYMTYIDDAYEQDGRFVFEGPHNTGRIADGMTVLILDCNGEEMGRFLIENSDVKKQGKLQGSVQTGEYVYLTGQLLTGKADKMGMASMLVDEGIISKLENF